MKYLSPTWFYNYWLKIENLCLPAFRTEPLVRQTLIRRQIQGRPGKPKTFNVKSYYSLFAYQRKSSIALIFHIIVWQILLFCESQESRNPNTNVPHGIQSLDQTPDLIAG